jgi:hypothetical protein
MELRIEVLSNIEFGNEAKSQTWRNAGAWVHLRVLRAGMPSRRTVSLSIGGD